MPAAASPLDRLVQRPPTRLPHRRADPHRPVPALAQGRQLAEMNTAEIEGGLVYAMACRLPNGLPFRRSAASVSTISMRNVGITT